VAQLSFYSAEANRPHAGDLAGLLCCRGQLAEFGRTAARLTLPLDEPWRARAMVRALGLRGIDATHTVTEEGRHGVRTAFRVDLLSLAEEWTKEGEKFAPSGLTLDGGALRLWTLAAGSWLAGSYLLGLDPDAPDTYDTVRGALGNAGLPATLHGAGLRIAVGGSGGSPNWSAGRPQGTRRKTGRWYPGCGKARERATQVTVRAFGAKVCCEAPGGRYHRVQRAH
jgi:hypothetical protein